MQSITLRHLTVTTKLLLLCATITLTHCSAPGAYFSPIQAVRPYKIGKHIVRPRITLITPDLYKKTIDYSRAHPKESLWYLNDYAYLVGPGDLIAITTWQHPEVSFSNTGVISGSGNTTLTQNQSTPVLINHSGDGYYPYIGSFHAAGLSTDQIRNQLIKKLKRYIRDPQVMVSIAQFRSHTIHRIASQVAGASASTIIPLNDQPLSLLSVASAGGSADTGHIFVIRGSAMDPRIFMLNAKSPANLLIADKFKLYPNDIVYIPMMDQNNWQTVINQLLSSATPIVTATALIEKL